MLINIPDFVQGNRGIAYIQKVNVECTYGIPIHPISVSDMAKLLEIHRCPQNISSWQ